MKKIKVSIVVLLTMVLMAGCNSQKKNHQSSSEKIVRQKKISDKKYKTSKKMESETTDVNTQSESDNKQAISNQSSAKNSSYVESRKSFKYTLLGTWVSPDSKVTYMKDGTLKQVSKASGMTNDGVYRVLSQTEDSLELEQTIKVQGAAEEKHKEKITFSDKNHFNDGLITWEKN